VISEAQAAWFDAMVESVIASLPPRYAAHLARTPLIVLDRPDAAMLADLGIDPDDEEAVLEICGLHTGVSLTEASVEDSGSLPSAIHIFREGVLALVAEEEAGEEASGTRHLALGTGKGGEKASGIGDRASGETEGEGEDDAVLEQIRITILHELGHEFGLDEDDLFELGYD